MRPIKTAPPNAIPTARLVLSVPFISCIVGTGVSVAVGAGAGAGVGGGGDFEGQVLTAHVLDGSGRGVAATGLVFLHSLRLFSIGDKYLTVSCLVHYDSAESVFIAVPEHV
jgi:hypothetical protein